MNNVLYQGDRPVPGGQISQQMEELENALRDLDKAFSELENRLVGITIPLEAGTPLVSTARLEDSASKAPALVPWAIRIESDKFAVTQLTDRITSLLHRIQL